MNSCNKEIIELAFKANRGIAKTSISPKAIIIDEEMRTSHLVRGSNSIAKQTKN